ncbi:hypothetical protein E2320_013933 [Naja naja]|nr:hypothetical protein E2320_013933 [Naja naja]
MVRPPRFGSPQRRTDLRCPGWNTRMQPDGGLFQGNKPQLSTRGYSEEAEEAKARLRFSL